MTNTEIMVADAEYWAGESNACELLAGVGETAIARIAHLENEYGLFLTSDDTIIEERGSPAYFKARSWFSLLIAAAEKYEYDLAHSVLNPPGTDKVWPFPIVHGEIPG